MRFPKGFLCDKLDRLIREFRSLFLIFRGLASRPLIVAVIIGGYAHLSPALGIIASELPSLRRFDLLRFLRSRRPPRCPSALCDRPGLSLPLLLASGLLRRTTRRGAAGLLGRFRAASFALARSAGRGTWLYPFGVDSVAHGGSSGGASGTSCDRLRCRTSACACRSSASRCCARRNSAAMRSSAAFSSRLRSSARRR